MDMCLDSHSDSNLLGYRKVDVRSNNEAWEHVETYEKDGNEGTHKRKWKCKYCGEIHTGNVARVEAHLGGVTRSNVAICLCVPADVQKRMAEAANKKKEEAVKNRKRKFESGTGNSRPNALQFGSGSSGVNPVGEDGNTSNSASARPSSTTPTGIFSQTALPGLTSGPGAVYPIPGAAEMGGSCSANPTGSTGLLSDIVSAVGRGNVGNAAQPEQPSNIVSMASTHMSLLSQPPAGWEGVDAVLTGSSYLLDFNGSGNSQAQIPGTAMAVRQMLLYAPDSAVNNACDQIGQGAEAGGLDRCTQSIAAPGLFLEQLQLRQGSCEVQLEKKGSWYAVFTCLAFPSFARAVLCLYPWPMKSSKSTLI